MVLRTPLLRLHKMGENYIHFGMNNPEYYDLMFIQNAPMDALKQMVGCDWTSGDAAIQRLMDTLAECMEKGLILKEEVSVVGMSVWGLVHGLVSLAIRDRFHKMVPKEQMVPMMLQSLNWMINTIDLSAGKTGAV